MCGTVLWCSCVCLVLSDLSPFLSLSLYSLYISHNLWTECSRVSIIPDFRFHQIKFNTSHRSALGPCVRLDINWTSENPFRTAFLLIADEITSFRLRQRREAKKGESGALPIKYIKRVVSHSPHTAHCRMRNE